MRRHRWATAPHERERLEACLALSAYYGMDGIRDRFREYGCVRSASAEPRAFGALEIAGYGGLNDWHQADGGPVHLGFGHLNTALESGADLYRSLGDGGGTVLALRLDYLDGDDPGRAFRNANACFEHLEPVHQAVRQVLGQYGLTPLVIMSARGYDFVLQAPSGAAFHDFLVRLGSREGTLPLGFYRLTAIGRLVVEMEWAHEGAGRVLEWVAHEAIRVARPRCTVPVELADLHRRGPAVRLDLSAYGDPLMARYLRCPYSADQEALVTGAAPELPFVINLPRRHESWPDLLSLRTAPERAAVAARSDSLRIPTVLDAPQWVADYEASALGRFHAQLDEETRERTESGAGRELVDLDLPPCLERPLSRPEALSQPRYLRLVSLGLQSLGLTPPVVARLVRQRVDNHPIRGNGLGRRADPAGRADFYVRLFCGAAAAGLEDGSFRCRSHVDQGLCPEPDCGYDMDGLFRRMRQATGPAFNPEA